jgi:flagellar biosynthesis protein FlhG
VQHLQYDQANDLRQLVRQSTAPDSSTPARLIVVAAGKGGVGTTTIATNLALALARHRRRCLLVDASGGNDGALLLGLQPRRGLLDVLSGRLRAIDAPQRAIGDLAFLAGSGELQTVAAYAPAAVDHLLAELRTLAPHTDFMVLDAGNSAGPGMERFFQAADVLLLVTTTDTTAVMNTYAAIKSLLGSPQRLPSPACRNGTSAREGTSNPHAPIVHLVVNRALGRAAAQDVFRRLAKTCWRFLAIRLQDAGHVPADPRVPAAPGPCVLAAPRSKAARHIVSLSVRLTEIQKAA